MINNMVITGVGVISPYGPGFDLLFDGLVNGRSCIGSIKSYDLSRCHSSKGAYCNSYRAEEYDSTTAFCRTARSTQFAIIASDQILQNDSFNEICEVPGRIGLIMSSARSALEKTEAFYGNLLNKGPRFVNPLQFQESVNNAPLSHISMRHGITGPSLSVTSGGVGVLQAFSTAKYWLQNNVVDYVLVVATEALNSISHEAYSHANGHAPVEADGVEESCPFDRRRNGFIFGEGAVAFMLELEPHAVSRNAKVEGKVIGMGFAHDAYKVGKYDKLGSGLKLSMKKALSENSISLTDVGCIVAAANSSQDGDLSETTALKWLYNNKRYVPPVSAIKSMIGELEGASGGFNILAALLSLKHNILFPTINIQQIDPDCDLDYVRGESRDTIVDLALINSTSFGGGCSTLLLAH